MSKAGGWVLGLIVLATVGACGTTTGVATPAAPTTTVPTVPDIPPIETPRTVVPFLGKPCAVLDDADIKAFGLEDGDKASLPDDESATCGIADHSVNRTVRVKLFNGELLLRNYETDADPSEFALIDVGGHPATRSTLGRGCRIVVAVADEQGFWVVFEPGRNGPDDEAACATATNVAAAILERLPVA